ncbi:hypothetical protein [Amycolatopsis suaedae]|uniref:Uncharacterized protein n=1 Tax=Amycolatopsis suaedae TaxID=2510978 RepID=A0A4Q7IXZ2_9PSEU|nr:hypothetical protein [Amycolatopsis suaedae]RZQ59830.1 hypothetical protein EWH70_32460 [Amycolatopsis suaedae]
MVVLALEALFVLAALVGVGLVSVPAALILGGVAGVVACERAAAEAKQQRRAAAERGEGRAR